MSQPQYRHLVQTISISANLATSNTFGQNINLNFIPDEMTVKQVTYKPYVVEDEKKNFEIKANEREGVYVLNSSLVSRSSLCNVNVSSAFIDGVDGSGNPLYRPKIYTIEPNTLHLVPNFTNNSVYSFELVDPLGITPRPRGLIYILLEFSKKERIPT